MKTHLHVHNSAARVLISLLMALAALAPGAAAPPVARASESFVVDSYLDAPDNGTLDLACVSTIGGCTLRSAIEQASVISGTTEITFDDALQGQTIVLSDTFGIILWEGSNITVTGGFSIAVSGVDLTGNKSLFQIIGSNNTLQGLILRDAPGYGVMVGDLDELKRQLEEMSKKVERLSKSEK